MARQIVYILPIWLFLSSCSSVLVIRSDPPDAKIMISVPGSKEPKDLGKTPLEITDKILEQNLKIDPNSGSYYEIFLEKDGFDKEKIVVPAARFVPLTTYLDVKLRTGASDSRLASQMVQLLLNAQKFASKGEYERGQIEIGKVLDIDPKFTRAMTMRGSIYYLQSKFDESLKWYEKALAEDSKLDEAVKMITEIKKKLGQQD